MRTLSDNFYLIVKQKSYYGLSARITSKSPSLDVGEVAIKLSVAVPDSLFSRPQLQAKVVIPADVVTPPVLDATVLDNVREIMEQQTGMDITLRVVEPDTQ